MVIYFFTHCFTVETSGRIWLFFTAGFIFHSHLLHAPYDIVKLWTANTIFIERYETKTKLMKIEVSTSIGDWRCYCFKQCKQQEIYPLVYLTFHKWLWTVAMSLAAILSLAELFTEICFDNERWRNENENKNKNQSLTLSRINIGARGEKYLILYTSGAQSKVCHRRIEIVIVCEIIQSFWALPMYPVQKYQSYIHSYTDRRHFQQ
jgi:hypothetical protein